MGQKDDGQDRDGDERGEGLERDGCAAKARRGPWGEGGRGPAHRTCGSGFRGIRRHGTRVTDLSNSSKTPVANGAQGSDRPADPAVKRYTFDRVVRMVLTGLSLFAVFLLIRFLADVLIPLAAAVLLAYIINPLVERVERRGNSRFAAVWMTLGGLAAAAILLALWLVPEFLGQFSRFTGDLRQMQQAWTAEIAANPLPQAPIGAAETPPQTTTGIHEFVRALSRAKSEKMSLDETVQILRSSTSGTLLGRLLGVVFEESGWKETTQSAVSWLFVGGIDVLSFGLRFIVGGFTLLVFILIFLVFILLEYRDYAATMRDYLPPAYRTILLDFLDEFDFVLGRFLRAQALVSLAVAGLSIIGFWIIGLPLAVPFGILVGALNMVPYLQLAALPPAMLLGLMGAVQDGGNLLWAMASPLIVISVGQLIQDVYINPKIQGEAVGLRPVAILLGVLIWGRLLGFFGLLMAIPLTCLFIAYYRRWVLLQSDAEARLNPNAPADSSSREPQTSVRANTQPLPEPPTSAGATPPPNTTLPLSATPSPGLASPDPKPRKPRKRRSNGPSSA